ncbi:MAG: hypothetical protein QG573_1013 [Acidobacteriota bacterium]|nr:hypothetical protein [Acidobacteriota bacterium]
MRRTITLLLLATLAGASVATADTVTCESQGHDHHYCTADTRDGVVLVHQLSRAGCWQGDTWDFDRSGIWVANGCRAEFRVGRAGNDWQNSMYHNGGYSQPVDWRNDQDVDRWSHGESKRLTKDEKAGALVAGALAVGILAAAAKDHHRDGDSSGSGYRPRSVVVCESLGRDHTYCSVGSTRHVELKRQLSHASCQYNRSWGYDRRGVWVGDGCRAEFWVE